MSEREEEERAKQDAAFLDRMRENVCGSKRPYLDKSAAAVGRSVLEARGRKRLKIYRCSLCQMWHIGTEHSGAKRRARRRQTLDRAGNRKRKKW